ncbi:hypothetical protein AMTR_s00070p00054280 [Amborella trichopoda]|uniref:Uncharacterized protein n=1 Tax=Amborella trichopoda TaxID=13333 RepID=U5DEE7_AMBTC|nr:hypothetical protein AMTR_s00070p00054280 [Amborella trichopoda]
MVMHSGGRARQWSWTAVIIHSSEHSLHTQLLSHSTVSVHDSKHTQWLSCSAMDMLNGLEFSVLSMYDSRRTQQLSCSTVNMHGSLSCSSTWTIAQEGECLHPLSRLSEGIFLMKNSLGVRDSS